MSFMIREATNADAPAIVAVVRAVYDEYGFSWDADDYHADLYNPEAHYSARGDCFLVALDEQIRGVVGICFHARIPGEIGTVVVHDGKVRAAGSDCSLERLYVHPDSRRRGIGEGLTREVLDRGRTAGRRAMELWSDKRFGDAHRLYSRFGAVAIGDRICHDPDQSPEWGLVIVL
jgi:putative acetyltransferase